MLERYHVDITGRGDKNIAFCQTLFQCNHPVTLHRGLQGTDRVNFSYQYFGAVAPHGLGTATAYVTIATDNYRFTGDHDISSTFYTIRQRFPATINIIKF